MYLDDMMRRIYYFLNNYGLLFLIFRCLFHGQWISSSRHFRGIYAPMPRHKRKGLKSFGVFSMLRPGKTERLSRWMMILRGSWPSMIPGCSFRPTNRRFWLMKSKKLPISWNTSKSCATRARREDVFGWQAHPIQHETIEELGVRGDALEAVVQNQPTWDPVERKLLAITTVEIVKLKIRHRFTSKSIILEKKVQF